MTSLVAWSVMSVLVATMLLLEQRPGASRTPYALAKIAAATTFVAFGAVRVGAVDAASDVKAAFMVALVLSMAGDVLLIPKHDKRFFLGGLAAFLLAHVAFVPAFAGRGVDLVVVAGAAGIAVAAAALVLRWVWPHVRGVMRPAIVAYVVVICAMVCTALGAWTAARHAGHGTPDVLLVVGAFCFWLSDLTIARERFIAPGFVNRLVGVPLYFFAQLLIIEGWCASSLLSAAT